MGRAIRTPRYRLVEWRDRESGTLLGRELYDHEKDRNEATNVAMSARYVDVVETLSGKLQTASRLHRGDP
jgi:iduronate 2-sulfatase